MSSGRILSTKTAILAAGAVAAACATVVALVLGSGGRSDGGKRRAAYVGSHDCRECHEEFYRLWSHSHHGTAMQPFTPEFARERLTPQTAPVVVGEARYRADIGRGLVVEEREGGAREYRMLHAMGGKDVFYFLTPMARGWLQVLPVAYDVHRGEWYDMGASGVRHFRDGPADSPLPWTDRAYTFNTSCHGCHVSQLETNYDTATDGYRTTWAEPGINCETCHGPGGEHVRVCRAARDGEPPEDLELVRYGSLTTEQRNATCAPCHAKMLPITASYAPGEDFFDHYDLVTLEDRDFHPDGHDLGENYTYTLWLTSPCAMSGELDCIHCHTSSGRYRFADKEHDGACLPCHRKRVDEAAAHHRHPEDKPGSRCVDCHMPKTRFGRMARSDHSMRPPTPAATLAFESPNACNICHADEKPEWADALVRKWHEDDYQAPVLRKARLIAAARARDWRGLDDMLAFISDGGGDEVVTTSLIRLLVACAEGRKLPVLVKALGHPSPLVRSAAAAGLEESRTREVLDALIGATGDVSRLVRVRAASSLAAYPRRFLNQRDRARLAAATREMVASFKCRPDDWASHYNMGNHLASRGDLDGALASFRRASVLRPDAVQPLVNASLIYARRGMTAEAERALRKAVRLAPGNAAAHFNLGLLLAEKGDASGAERALRAALKSEPGLAGAAHNLGVLLSRDRMDEAVRWCRKASELQPDSHKYAYTLAYYLNGQGNDDEALRVLAKLVDAKPAGGEAYALMGAIYEERAWLDEAEAVYRKAMANKRLPPEDRARYRARAEALRQ